MTAVSQAIETQAAPAAEAEGTQLRKPAPYSNPYLTGIGLGLVLLAAFVVMGRGLGASGFFKAIAAFAGEAIAPQWTAGNAFLGSYLGDGTSSPLQNYFVYLITGVAAGAFLSGLLAHRVGRAIEKGPRVSVRARFLMAFSGGTITAVGAGLARGCTSGQALTGGSLLNLGSWAFMLSVFAGAYALAYFVRWQWK
ncbi:MAG: YeeE/YedE thiosulfate transporter family protein [Vicinamibacterales bacterium]